MRILLPVDGSIYSQTAIRFLAARQSAFGDDLKIELLNVQHLIPKALIELLSLTAVNAYSEAESQKIFDSLDDSVTRSGLIAETQSLTGDIGDTIVEEAQKTQANLVVMGTHGRSGLSSLLLGSVSIRVLSKIQCPLLLIRENSPVIQNHLRVGLCVDDAQHAIAAAKLISEHINFFGQSPDIKVIHVVNPAERPPEQDAVTPVMDIFRESDIPAQFVKLEGIASKSICQYADKHLDLIVMGSHGYGNLKSAVLGSTASRIAANSSLPILIVKA